MKLLLAIASPIILATTLSAATYVVGNNQGAESNQITDSLGNLFINTTGSFAFGTFTNDSAVTNATSAATLLDSDWTEFGSNERVFDPNAVTIGSGIVTATGDSTNTSFNDSAVYLVAGNATSLDSATEFFVYRFNTNFTNVQDGSANVSLTLGVDSGSILQGSNGPVIVNSGFIQTPNASFQTASFSAVPEPSSTALLGLGSVALLLRRRR